MTGRSVIDPRMIQAYRETEYRVHGEHGFTLLVDRPSAELLLAHARRDADCSAFLTACNPFSESLAPEANAARQVALARELSDMKLAFLPGTGQHPSNGWPGEASFLVFGLGLEAARLLGTRLEQNAIVWSGADAVPRLVLLR